MRNKKTNEEVTNLHEIAAKQLKNKDFMKLIKQTKEKSMQLLDEQGISTV